MSDVDTTSHQDVEAAAAAATIKSDAPVDIHEEDLAPEEVTAGPDVVAEKPAGRGRPKGKPSAPKEKSDNVQGIEALLLPKSKVIKIAKSAVPDNTKLQKEVPIALTRSAVVFISYLTSLAQEQAAEAGVKTIKPEHVLEALPELDWGEADTARLRKDLKKQLKAFRAIAKAKKEGKPLPTASTSRGPGRPKKAVVIEDEEAEEEEDQELEEGADAGEEHAQQSTKINIEYQGNGKAKIKRPSSRNANDASSDEEDNVNIRQIRADNNDVEDDIEEEEDEEDEEEEEEEEDDDEEEEEEIEDPDEVDPAHFEDEMGRALDGVANRGQEDEDMDD